MSVRDMGSGIDRQVANLATAADMHFVARVWRNLGDVAVDVSTFGN